MAERRMISKSVARTDAFLSMPLSAQALYFHLNLEADDDGFVSNPTTVIRMIGAKPKDLIALIDAQYIIDLGDKIIVIRHWHQNNYLRKDRYKPTIHQSVKRLLKTDMDNAYQLQDSKTPNNSELLNDERYTNGIPNGNQMATQYSIDKDRIDKGSIEKRKEEPAHEENRKPHIRTAADCFREWGKEKH